MWFLYILFVGFFCLVVCFFTVVPLYNHPDCSCTSKTVTLEYQSIASGCGSGFTWETSVQTNFQRWGRGGRCGKYKPSQKGTKDDGKAPTPHPPPHPNAALPSFPPHQYMSPSFVSKDQLNGQKKLTRETKRIQCCRGGGGKATLSRKGCSQSRVPKKQSKPNPTTTVTS